MYLRKNASKIVTHCILARGWEKHKSTMSTILELAFAACQKLSVPQNIVLCHEINLNALWAEQKKKKGKKNINLQNGRKTKKQTNTIFFFVFLKIISSFFLCLAMVM